MTHPHELPPLLEASEGSKICAMCGGQRVCWSCRGEGVRDGKRCEECLGGTRCVACDGSGQLPLSPGEDARTALRPPSYRLPPVTDPGPQFDLCPSCDGHRTCWLCKGRGMLTSGQQCGECLGRKQCIGCDGGGVIPKRSG